MTGARSGPFDLQPKRRGGRGDLNAALSGEAGPIAYASVQVRASFRRALSPPGTPSICPYHPVSPTFADIVMTKERVCRPSGRARSRRCRTPEHAPGARPGCAQPACSPPAPGACHHLSSRRRGARGRDASPERRDPWSRFRVRCLRSRRLEALRAREVRRGPSPDQRIASSR